MGKYYGEGNTAAEKVSGGTFDNVALNCWGDAVEFDADISVAELKRFASVMFSRAVRAEQAVEEFVAANARQIEERKNISRIFGESAKAAALKQEWCGEYEEWTEKIVQTLRGAGYYSEAQHYADAAERREKFSITLEFLARDAYSAQDYAYSLTSQRDNHTYGCKPLSTTDAVPVIENNDDDDNSEDDESY